MEAASGFPPSYLAFLKENHIDPRIYDLHKELPRYVRILRFGERAAADVDALTQQIAADAGCAVSAVGGVPGFLRIDDQSVKLRELRAHASGDIVGMDVSSGIAALALSVQPGHNVLDLCCAPGAKLLHVAELLTTGLATDTQHGTVTGVDVSPHRLATCRSLIKKHAGRNRGFVRLYAQDGTAFASAAPRARWWDPEAVRAAGPCFEAAQPRLEAARPWFAPRLLSTGYACSGHERYDRVLVDAECTHDGSLAHVQKYERWGWQLLDAQVVNDERPLTVPALQSRLLENGWRLLRPGGVLVYSTCSLSRFQNEYVLAGFLARHAEDEARVEPIPLALDRIGVSPAWAPADAGEWRGLESHRALFARMQNAVRLDPRVSNTSGMFIARIAKLRDAQAAFTLAEVGPLRPDN
ncbi:hypothetical protein IWW50_002210 [Coemansia erecta]|nr:hypothetical protein GGF43_001699 [Coemansia sp. RSA 2618]KAJ2826771.1 hypothetical protein IWW50_002210 [Coemansia erecta]